MSFFPNSKTARNFWEIVTGFLLILAALLMVRAAFSAFHRQSLENYHLSAIFQRVDGLDIGSEVRLAGVKIGNVEKLFIDPKTWQAHALLSLKKDISLPVDSNAMITSDSLLGGKYIALMPGGDEAKLPPDGVIMDTQGTISLEELLSKFVFSAENKDNNSAAASTKHS